VAIVGLLLLLGLTGGKDDSKQSAQTNTTPKKKPKPKPKPPKPSHTSVTLSVRTTVPSGLVTGLPGEILLPTSTTRRATGSVILPAEASTAEQSKAPFEDPQGRWYAQRDD